MKICVKCKVASRPQGCWLCRACCRGLIENLDDFSSEHAVYALMRGGKNNRRVVYIGVTNNPVERVGKHFTSKYKKFKSMRIVKNFATRDEAGRFETRAIDLLRPCQNVLVLESEKESSAGDSEIFQLFGVVQQDRRRREILTRRPQSC